MGGRFLDPAVTRPGTGEFVHLEQPLRYERDDGRVFAVPAGFRTDLASVPRWLRWLAPAWQHSLRAGIFHDCGYRWFEVWVLARPVLDDMFYEQLRADGTHRVRAWAMRRAVGSFGGFAWNDWRDTPEADKGAKPPPPE